MWKSRWPSWAFRPNKPCGFCGRKAALNHWSHFVPNISTDIRGREALHHHHHHQDHDHRLLTPRLRCLLHHFGVRPTSRRGLPPVGTELSARGLAAHYFAPANRSPALSGNPRLGVVSRVALPTSSFHRAILLRFVNEKSGLFFFFSPLFFSFSSFLV